MKKTALVVALTAGLAATPAVSHDHVEHNIFATAGYVHIDFDDQVDSQFGIVGELESVAKGRFFNRIDVLADFELSQQRISIGDDDARATYFQIRVGPGSHLQLSNSVDVYGAMKFVGTYEWLSVNGVSQNANGRAEYYFDYRPEVGLLGSGRGWLWRTSLFSDGFEGRADRSTPTLSGQVYRERRSGGAHWGLKLQGSSEKFVFGVSTFL